MNRRRFLAVTGTGVATGLVGCLGNSYDGVAANEYGYETTETADVAVPLVPLDDAIAWHESEDVLFVDARGQTQYQQAHIDGAVHSPAPDGQGDNDPVETYDTDKRIVTYCTCPHHLSTLRAASLIGDDYAHTYAIDEGFGPWRENGYPVSGEEVTADPQSYRIEGRTDARYGGESAWAWHDPSGQREATPIEADGRFSLHLKFYDIGPESSIRVKTPAGEQTAPLRELTSESVVL